MDNVKQDIVAARLIGRVLMLAARTLGVEYDASAGLQAFLDRIIMAAQRGGLDPQAYRLVWMMGGGCRR